MVFLVVGLTSYVMVFRLAQNSEQEIVSRDRELAKVLAGLRSQEGQLNFEVLKSFVGSSDKVKTGIVYAIEIDDGGEMRQGALNPRLFAALDPTFSRQMRDGRRRVLSLLAESKIERRGRIKEYSLPIGSGILRLGFDLRRIDDQIHAEQRVGLGILLAGLAIGILSAVVLARRLARPVKRLASAMEAVARGEVDQTVQVRSSDELASLARSFNQMTRSLRELSRVRDLFSRYLSPQVAQRILKEANPLEMVAEERAVTVAAFAFHGFASLMRRSPQREAVRILNEHLPPIIDAVVMNGGVVNEIGIGRVLAVWGAPADVVEPERKALIAAMSARDAIVQERRIQAAAGSAGLSLSIGVCTGRAIAANVGAAVRLSYKVLHGAADLAAKIEEMAGPDEILASEATYARVRELFEGAAAPPLMLEDIEDAIPLYRITEG
jgi:adenylate cyclase